jgi:magnesium transporter
MKKRHTRRHGKPPAGARPGTLVIPADALPTRIAVMDYTPAGVRESVVKDARSLRPFAGEGTMTWIDVQGFGDEKLLRQIAELFHLHPLAMADVVNAPQRPKFDSYESNHLLICQMAHTDGDKLLDLEQVSVVVGPAYVLTFQERHGDLFDPVRERIRAGAGPIRTMGPDYLAYALLDRVVDGYFPVVERLGDGLQEIEERILDDDVEDAPARLHEARRQLAALRRLIWSQRDALNTALRQDETPFTPPVRVYLRDVYDHAVQVMDVVESHREIAMGLMDIYLSTVSNRMNEVMKVLTIMASLFVPLTFIAGVYGMNFEHTPELHFWWGYPMVWLVMLVTAGGLLLFFRRQGWLGAPRRRKPGRPGAA